MSRGGDRAAAVRADAASPGGGSARRSILPLALSGSDGSHTIEVGSMYVRQRRAQVAPAGPRAAAATGSPLTT